MSDRDFFFGITTPILAGMGPFPKSAHQRSSGILLPGILSGSTFGFGVFIGPDLPAPDQGGRRVIHFSTRRFISPNTVRSGGGVLASYRRSAGVGLYQKATFHMARRRFHVESTGPGMAVQWSFPITNVGGETSIHNYGHGHWGLSCFGFAPAG